MKKETTIDEEKEDVVRQRIHLFIIEIDEEFHRVRHQKVVVDTGK